MTLSSTTNLPGYKTALEGTVVYPIPDANYVRISGETRADFLQRQTTNDLDLLTTSLAVPNVLTSPTGRILDVFLMVAEPDAIALLTLPGRGPATAEHFQHLIFFMDRVEVSDVSREVAQFNLDGPQASNTLLEIGVDTLPAADQIVHAAIGDASVRIIGREGLNGAGYWLLVSAELSESVGQTLIDAGVERLSLEAHNLLRIEAGHPGPAELSSDFTPLEANLAHTISMTKGCYTGQEVIARQINYDKITRQLVGLRLSAPVGSEATIYAEGKSAGMVTSVAQSPRHGNIALAFVKRPHFAPGTYVSIGKDDHSVEAEVVSLPFGV